MFDFLKSDKIEVDTTNMWFDVLPMNEDESLPDTLYFYYVIVGSFKDYNNAVECSKQYDFSDILPMTDDGWYRVSKDYYFDKEEAILEKNKLGDDVWLLKNKLLLGN
jgi:hypothetical protein